MPGDQLPVPAQQRLRRDDPDPQHVTRQHPGERRQNKPVLRLQPRTSHLPSQHRHLVTQHQQFHVLRHLTTTTGHHQSQHDSEGRIDCAEEHLDDHA
jgi:hypothetical protein